MKAHDLAKVLLKGSNLPIVIPSYSNSAKADAVEGVFILQNCDSPFEYAILLESKECFNEHIEIDIDSI